MKTIAYVNVGEQWDIWISRGINEEEERNVMIFLENAISSQIALGSTAFKKEVLSQYIQVARQGEERFLFRRPLKIFTDFEPPGKTAPKPEPKLRPRVEKKNEGEEKKEDDVYGNLRIGTGTSPRSTASKSPRGGGGISFKDNVSFFGFDAAHGENNDDSKPNTPGTTEPAPHKYVDFYSVHGAFHHGHMEHKTTGEVELSLNDSEVMNQGGNNGDEGDGGDMDSYLSGGYGVVATHEVGGTNADGSPIVTQDMLRVVEKSNISPADRAILIKEAARDPRCIVGYQVEIDEGIFAGIFVVTKAKKTLFHKTMYHLSAADGDEFWLRLARGPGKKGQKFRPLRRVVNQVL